MVIRSPKALKVALDLRMKVSHSQVVDLLSFGGNDAVWTLYLQQYPSPADRAPGLRVAVERSLIELVRRFISTGVDANSVDADGSTLLHSLSTPFHPELVPLLVNHGAIVDQVDKWGFTPLLSLATRGVSTWTAALLQHGASLLAQSHRHVNMFTCGNWNWIHSMANVRCAPIPVSFIRHCAGGVHLLSELAPSQTCLLLKYMSYQDWDLLGVPCLLESLLQSSSDKVVSGTMKYVCSGPAGNQYASEALRIVSPQLIDFQSSETITSLLDIIKCSGTDVDRVSPMALTPLLHACAAGVFVLISALLERGADPCYQASNGTTSLLLLAKCRTWALPEAEATTKALLSAVAASPKKSSTLDARDLEGRTATTLCIVNENVKMLRAVLGVTECSLNDRPALVALLSTSVSHPQALGTVLEHLKQFLPKEDFESSMRLVLDENEGFNLLEKACALKNAEAIRIVLSVASQAYGEDLLLTAKALEASSLPLISVGLPRASSSAPKPKRSLIQRSRDRNSSDEDEDEGSAAATPLDSPTLPFPAFSIAPTSTPTAPAAKSAFGAFKFAFPPGK